MHVQDLTDEVVDGKVRARRAPARRETLADERLEEVGAQVERAEEHDREGAERIEELTRTEEAPVRHHEHESAGDEPDRSAAGERRDVDEQEEDESRREGPLQSVPARKAQIDRR